jgi:hypothetical protein
VRIGDTGAALDVAQAPAVAAASVAQDLPDSGIARLSGISMVV